MKCVRCGHDPTATIAASWSFFVDKELVSLNAHVVNGRAKWQQAAYRRERDAWQQWMTWGRVNNKIPYAATKRRVKLVRVFTGRQREYDADNLAGGAKPCVDGMVRAGLLQSDDRAGAEIAYDQRRGGPNERGGVWVTIEELEVAS